MASTSFKHIATLFKKDLLLEVRQQYTFYGILLYIASTTFVVYLTLGQPEYETWNALFWVVQLFVCINAVAKSFLAESRGRMLYFYSIAGARDFVLSKLLFNAVLMLLMTALSLVVFTLFLGDAVEKFLPYLGISLLGGMGLSFVFTFLAAIAAKAQQQAALMAIMGFPVVIPELLLLSKVSKIAFADVVQAGLWQMLLLLVAFDIMVIILSIILFPFLWKD
ncbi:heme exporter protein CcmB [Foetidibacter luteolus]|uniref:heme exporter protein CcmB n=1 Tax=Foetidibacter luteolus TaxID=2608880 RepID=UPI00129B03F6|nr:heme exporter protein CcmB [Foetidibacter luteolus]